MASLTPHEVGKNRADNTSVDESTLPVTSYLCKWNAPRRRKESSLPISEAVFHKHVYGRQRKHTLKPIADFDPHLVHLRGQANVKGSGIGVSLLFDEECRCWSTSTDKSSQPVLPSQRDMRGRVELFKQSLIMTPQKMREIEQSTREQNISLLWFSVQSYRITASFFDQIYHLRPDTSPNLLVLQIPGKKTFTSQGTYWGIQNESKTLEKYQQLKKDSGEEITCTRSGFVVCEDYPFLGCSPDAVAYDAHATNLFGLVEIKCPYSV